jgi:hypothetical protein
MLSDANRTKLMEIAIRFLGLVLAYRYQFTEHALEKLDEGGLTLHDVISCLAGGRVRRSWPRERKYENEGRAMDGRFVRVVGRLIRPRLLRIITVYEVETK